MGAAFGLDAFDQIGRAAVLAGTKLQIAVYGGSALMLASNFRFATEAVDVSELERPLPGWLPEVVHEIARKNLWQDDWFNDAVAFHLSSLADSAADHLEFGTFPRERLRQTPCVNILPSAAPPNSRRGTSLPRSGRFGAPVAYRPIHRTA
jgi:hypothetical protein